MLGFLPEYVRVGEDFNMNVRGFVSDALAPFFTHARGIAMGLCAAALIGVLLVVARFQDEADASRPDQASSGWDVLVSARRVVLAFVLLVPTAIHPWYALWLVPLVALRPHFAGVWIVGVLPLSYLKYATGDGQMPLWVLWLEWVPALAFLAIASVGRRRAFAPRVA